MSDLEQTTVNLRRLGGRIAQVYTNRILTAQNAYLSSGLQAFGRLAATPDGKAVDPWSAWVAYQIDCFQRVRSVLGYASPARQ